MFYFIDLNTFFDNFVHNIHKVDGRLDDYLADPNENNIHDIRTSIRRLESAFLACPKQMRKKKMSQFIKESKRLFKANSEIIELFSSIYLVLKKIFLLLLMIVIE